MTDKWLIAGNVLIEVQVKCSCNKFVKITCHLIVLVRVTWERARFV